MVATPRQQWVESTGSPLNQADVQPAAEPNVCFLSRLVFPRWGSADVRFGRHLTFEEENRLTATTEAEIRP